MITFNQIDSQTFLKDYWQKKPLLIKQALPNFISPITPEELAGLSLEDEVESRMVLQHGTQDYELRTGPFSEQDYASLPEKNWTLLVQGMDRLIPEVQQLLNQFDFIPRWRIDDIMISYATEGGNVGPHFDHYDVFLLQAAGQRKWMLTAHNCELDNYLENTPLRLMREFNIEEEYVLEAGDILYLPPKWGHHGVALDDDCMTYSIGYRSYKGQELWDSFGDYLSESSLFQTMYLDPNWQNTQPGEINNQAWLNAKQLLQAALNDEQSLQRWFGRFATQLDQQAHNALPEPLTDEEAGDLEAFIEAIKQADYLERDPICRFAFQRICEELVLTINGFEWPTEGIADGVIMQIANHDRIDANTLQRWSKQRPVTEWLYQLWIRQFLQFPDTTEQAECFEGEA
ncbi:cupin domain-containing protein [Thiomicrospira microaerophila]|uniref:cupin domain-containing protein n=1 Tax=Thiomicrospira microaerophila TaxID=406020 RepID=UPI00200C9150|nr:cupin domain-containing protein [Thiomicrospira microaerophila]UQB41420.1 cupin domain-containing protein [Thiomicrospira microaerophila]